MFYLHLLNASKLKICLRKWGSGVCREGAAVDVDVTLKAFSILDQTEMKLPPAARFTAGASWCVPL